MIPTVLSPVPPVQQAIRSPGADSSLQWIEQYSEELLLTVQAFQRLHAALQSKTVGKFA